MITWDNKVKIKLKIKRWFIGILKALLGRIDEVTLKKCSVDKEVSFTASKFVPDDNKWHHVALTVEYWIKIGDKERGIETREEFLDGFSISGVKVDEFRIQRGVE